MFKLFILLFLFSCSSFTKKDESLEFFPHMADIYQGSIEIEAKQATKGFKLLNDQILVIHTQFNSKFISIYVMPINHKTFNKKEYISIPKYSFFYNIDAAGNFSTETEFFFPKEISEYALKSEDGLNRYLIYFPNTINIYSEITNKVLTN